jgi:hypothetical protein
MWFGVDSFALHFVQIFVPDLRCLVLNLDNAVCSFLFNVVFSDLPCSFVF